MPQIYLFFRKRSEFTSFRKRPEFTPFSKCDNTDEGLARCDLPLLHYGFLKRGKVRKRWQWVGKIVKKEANASKRGQNGNPVYDFDNEQESGPQQSGLVDDKSKPSTRILLTSSKNPQKMFLPGPAPSMYPK